MQKLTFRSSRVIYYGPHSCENCGAMIVKMGREFGGTAFNQPEGPIYPNTEWHVHICDPDRSNIPCNVSLNIPGSNQLPLPPPPPSQDPSERIRKGG